MNWLPRSVAIPMLSVVAALCLTFVFASMNSWYEPADAIPVLRFSAGPELTRRYQVADYLREVASSKGVSLQMIKNAGSEECLKQIQAGLLDVAVVSSGIKIPNDDAVTVLGALNCESFHVLIKPNINKNIPLSKALLGKRINLGVPGSTEWILGHEFLKFARLQLPELQDRPIGSAVTVENWSKQRINDHCKGILNAPSLQRQTMVDELPDCFLLLDTMPCQQVPLLVEAAGYEIRPLPASRAFLADLLQTSASDHTVVEREFLEPSKIEALSYCTTEPFPAADCETVGVRLLLVANRSVKAEAIAPLMQAVFESEFTHRLAPKSPREISGPYEIHPAAAFFFDRDKPMMVMQEAINWLSSGLSFLGAFSAGALSLWGIIRRRKWRTAADYIAEVRAISDTIHTLDQSAMEGNHIQDVAKQLDDRLMMLQHALIDDVCAGRMSPDPSFFSTLALIKEAQEDLPNRRHEGPGPTRDTVRPRRGNMAA